ncbi:hypothetical protein BC829DRAFT_399236, partial [Chytridium lagenaria]
MSDNTSDLKQSPPPAFSLRLEENQSLMMAVDHPASSSRLHSPNYINNNRHLNYDLKAIEAMQAQDVRNIPPTEALRSIRDKEIVHENLPQSQLPFNHPAMQYVSGSHLSHHPFQHPGMMQAPQHPSAQYYGIPVAQ